MCLCDPTTALGLLRYRTIAWLPGPKCDLILYPQAASTLLSVVSFSESGEKSALELYFSSFCLQHYFTYTHLQSKQHVRVCFIFLGIYNVALLSRKTVDTYKLVELSYRVTKIRYGED